jgi:hypothetical protein
MCETLCISVSLAELLPALFSQKCCILHISFSFSFLVYYHQSMYSAKLSKISQLQCHSFIFILTYLPTYLLPGAEYIWKANRCTASQEIPRILMEPKC